MNFFFNMTIKLLMVGGDLVVSAAYALIGLAVFVFSRSLFQQEEERAAQDSLENQGAKTSQNGLVKITRPFFTQYVVPLVRGQRLWDSQRQKIRRRIISSGLRDEFTVDEFIAFKLFLILFFPIVGGFLKVGDFLDLSWSTVALSGVLGWFYPDLWIKGRITRRQKQIRKALPFIVDLLALSTEAGLDFIGAIGKVVEKAGRSPLVDEFEQLLKEIKVGSSRADALRELGIRTDMQEISSFVAILISADQMGASIGKTLRQQSDQIRSQRFIMAEKAGARAQQLIIFPIVFLVVPAVMLIIFGPYLSSFSGVSTGF